MTSWEFWAVALALAAAVAAVLVAALRKAPEPETRTAEADLAVYKDQMAEIGRDLARGTIGPDEAARLRAEVSKRVIEADRARQAGERVRGGGPATWAAVLILALVLPGGLAIYWWLGAPGYPDMALKPRLQALDAGIAARPSQAAELERLNAPRDPAIDERLAKELAAVTEPAALQEIFRSRFEAGELQAAVRVQERIVALKGDGASADDHANLALALVAEAQGYVSPEAEAELRASLERDIGNELSRYLVGEMFLQGGRYDQAFRFWRPLVEGGTPGSPWVASIRERIEQVAELAGVRYALPQPAGKAPSATDKAAAGGMSGMAGMSGMSGMGTMGATDQAAMIDGMVAQLSDRLAREGGPVEDWDRLIRSLVVLERMPEAQRRYDEAKTRFEGRTPELSFLRMAAVEGGLKP